MLVFCIIAAETWGSIYFFDTFLERKRTGRLEKCRYMVLYFSFAAGAYLGACLIPMWMKVLLMVSVYMVFCAVFYEAGWKQRIFFSGLNYSLMFLADFFTLQMETVFVSQNRELAFLLIPAKMVWLCPVFIVRKIWKGKHKNGELSHKEWLKFFMILLLTAGAMLLMFFCRSAQAKVCRRRIFLYRRG